MYEKRFYMKVDRLCQFELDQGLQWFRKIYTNLNGNECIIQKCYTETIKGYLWLFPKTILNVRPLLHLPQFRQLDHFISKMIILKQTKIHHIVSSLLHIYDK